VHVNVIKTQRGVEVQVHKSLSLNLIEAIGHLHSLANLPQISMEQEVGCATESVSSTR
jgi:hypothetical protein